ITHKVDENETLFDIAMLYYGSGHQQDEIVHYNGITNPEKEIQAGMELSIPNPRYMVSHTVAKGETLQSISEAVYNTDEHTVSLASHNGLSDPNDLKYGMTFHIPKPSVLTNPVQEEEKVDTNAYGIVINKRSNLLTVFHNDDVVTTVPVSTSVEPSLIPEGNFQIITKHENQLGISHNNLSHPLGYHWIGLNVPGTDGT